MKARLIRSKGGTALLESLDSAERRTVPSTIIQFEGDSYVALPDEEWRRGVEMDFTFNDVTIDAQTVKAYFHRRGLFSRADIVADRASAREALNDALGDILTRLLTQEDL